MESSAGDVVGSYRLVRRLGSGAMGEVWLGEHTHTGASAAIKRIRAARQGPSATELFARERQAIVRLAHPHIVPLFEIGDSHLAMAYLPGADLGRRLRTPMNPGEAVHLARQIASALAHAHARQVVHRDVKPSNILLDRRGNAFLADFGLATLEGDDGGIRGGTLGFMAPEQACGAPAGPAVDQHALGRTLMEMLAGTRLPRDRDEALERLPAELPGALCAALERATAADPAARWPSMEAFDQALAELDLRDFPAPVQLASEVRVREPFRWCTRPHRREAIGVDIQRADYRLGALEGDGLLSPEACASFRARTGYAELGWAIFGRAGRLGPIDQAAALARATEVVVLMHGWLHGRDIWRDIAAAVCRDNAQAIVLAPDLGGFGESRFTGDAPRPEHLEPPAMARAALALLELLTLRELPCVLAGHSLAAVHLLAIDHDELGGATARIALAPVWPFVDAPTRRRMRAGELVMPILRRLFRRLLVSSVVRNTPATAELTDAQLDLMEAELMRLPSSVAVGMSRAIRRMQPARGAALRDCIIVLGARDPLSTEDVVGRALAYLEIPATNVWHMATGGHYPHVEIRDHPEWTAQNTARLVEIIDASLVGCRDGTPPSTLLATPVSDASDVSAGTDSTLVEPSAG